jgi:hypothetical protein
MCPISHFRFLLRSHPLSAERDYPKNPNDGENCAIAIEKELSALRDSAAGQLRVVSPTYEYVYLARVNGRPVFEFEHFGIFPVNAREVCSEGFFTGFHYDARRWFRVEIKNFAWLDIHSVSLCQFSYR